MLCDDIGILASKDILALEKATIDLINKKENIILREKSTDSYEATVEHAHKKGLGNINYNLINVHGG